MIISTQNLDFSYQKKPVLKQLNLQVPEASIYGFLGPNGAGKSTSIRLLLGLLKPKNGAISIFNKPIDDNRTEILKNVGALIESPSFYRHLSAYDNLSILRKLRKVSPVRITEVLETVGLQDVTRKKVKQFSMGMKQRLGIAAALLHDPKILILDEPTNGLDPQGIKAIRDLLLMLNKEQDKTIFISSHILAEIEMIATHIGIIQNGELLYQNPIADLKKNFSEDLIVLKVGSETKEEDLLNLPEILSLDSVHDNEYNIKLNPDYSYNDLIQSLNRNQIRLEDIFKTKQSLEHIFLKLTKSKIQ